MSNSEFGSISFDLPKNQSNVIKVIGVGGGGSNAINHMFKQGIKGVDFIVVDQKECEGCFYRVGVRDQTHPQRINVLGEQWIIN